MTHASIVRPHDQCIAYGDPCPYCGEPDDTHHPGIDCDPEPEPDEDKLIAWKRRHERRLR